MYAAFAHHNDWSVCTVWLKYKKEYYIVDILRRNMNFPELQLCVKKLVQAYRPRNILVEDKGSGTSLIYSNYKAFN